MRPGIPAHPKRIVNPQFYDAYRTAILEKQHSCFSIAIRIGCKHQTIVSALFNTIPISATPLNVSRLQRVAEIIGFQGEIFLQETNSAAMPRKSMEQFA